MATIVCARCGASEDEASASYAEEGLVCASCAVGESARDAAQMQAAVDAAASAVGRGPRGLGDQPGSLDVVTSSSSAEEHSGPASALHTALQGRGLSFQRTRLSKTVTTPLGSKTSEGFRESWTLPSATAVQASFSPEGIGRKITKLFKKELQAGDKEFDDAVYVGTDTRDATAAFLTSAEHRAWILALVQGGGFLRIEGVRVEGQVMWAADRESPGDDAIARLVEALLR